QRPHFQLHQALGGKPDHLAQEIGIGTLGQKRLKVHHLFGHRWFPGLRLSVATRSLPEIADDRRKPLAATALCRARERAGLLPLSYTTTGDTSSARRYLR